jgi:hypothetical protein
MSSIRVPFPLWILKISMHFLRRKTLKVIKDAPLKFGDGLQEIPLVIYSHGLASNFHL